ncbi:MAG: hypothetical protein A2W19_12810 [Spirochaetes bacterium RBG_16_49_21]|nr:MAG: hypothetical protein A2W19_12810 [Spirochaetes bacterium RBG_16_49_21]
MKLSRVATSCIMTCLLAAAAEAAPVMAFGYLANKSKDGNYDYLETIFPNSFAGSIQNIFWVDVIKPIRVNRIMKKYNLRLEKEYRPYELVDIARKLSADYFINGNFIILPKDRIRININLCSSGGRLFTFSNTGRMEAEIFKLVDRIANIIIDFMSKEKLFMSGIIPGGSKIGIFTNLSGEDLNYLYYSFLSGGYRIAGIQANSLNNNLSTDMIESFKYMSGSENSYQTITDLRSAGFRYGTWAGPGYITELNYIKKIYRIYDQNYFDAKAAILNKMSAAHDMDKILVIGFNNLKTGAWIRCLDVRSKDLIWMQSDIAGSIPEICSKIIKRMSSGISPRRE